MGEGVCVRDIVNALSKSFRTSGARAEFTGTHRPGDPNCFVADIARAKAWGWVPARRWRDGIPEYAAWWRREKGGIDDARDVEAVSAAHVP